MSIRTYLERGGKILEMAVTLGSDDSKEGKQSYRRRMGTYVNRFIMNDLGDYSMKEERIKIETETEEG